MSESDKNLHSVLGVEEGAGPEVLRKAYLALAVKYHPDRNPGNREAEERFKEISQAYAILSDPAARARYERGRSRKSASSGAAPGGGASASNGPKSAGPRPSTAGEKSSSAEADSGPRPGEAPDFDEVLANFFKTAKGRETLRDLEGELNKSGIKFTVDDFAQWLKKGPATEGRAASPERKASLWKRLTSRLSGVFSGSEPSYEVLYTIALLPQAAASGTTVEISYQRDEKSQGHHRLKVKIPAGAKDGDRLRLAGQGRLKPDQSRGDLILTIMVGKQPSLEDLFK